MVGKIWQGICLAGLAAGLIGCGNSNPPPAPAGPTTSSTSSAPAAAKKTYTCSMHPEVVTDAPGKCPKCGMALVEKK